MAKLLMDDRPIMFLPKLAKALGSCARAIVLQQIYWLCNQPHSGVTHNGHKWVWGTYEEWCELYFSMWSAHTLGKHIRKLESDGYLISEQLKAHDYDQTKHYRVDLEALHSNLPELVDSSKPIPVTPNLPIPVGSIYRSETSTETSTETSKIDQGDAGKPQDTTVQESSSTEGDNQTMRTDTGDDRDGRWLREMVDSGGFVYMDRDATRIAMQIEQDWNDEQILEALEATKAAHQKKISQGDRGITAPLAYLKAVLLGMEDDHESKRKAKEQKNYTPDEYAGVIKS